MILFAFAVLVDAGSRHEVDYPSGITHMLEKMAFQVKFKNVSIVAKMYWIKTDVFSLEHKSVFSYVNKFY